MKKKVNKGISSKNIHTVSLLVANKPGVLVRIALVFARRGFNIDSLVVSPSVNPRFSRMTITAQGDLSTLEQIVKQSAKLVDVIHATEHMPTNAIDKELALFKVRVKKSKKSNLLKLIKKYRAKVINTIEDILIIEITATTSDLDEFERLLKKYSIVEMVRSGKLLMTVGKEPT